MFTIEKPRIFGRTGRVEFVRNRWIVQGHLKAANASALSTLIAALEAAMVNGGNLAFMLDGSTPSEHTLDDADTLNGVNIRQFQWLGTSARGSGVEYVLRRSFRIIFEGDVDPADQDTDIVHWTETIMRMGDTPAHNVWMESFNGAAEYQTVITYPKHVTLQIGMAIGRTGYPAVATPLWTSPYYISKLARVGTIHPSYIGVNEFRNYGKTWKYHFESDTGLAGGPTLFTP